MTIGANANIGALSYVAFSKETTFGTYASATTAVEAISCGFITEIDSMKLETMNKNRGFSKRVALDKKVTGALEVYMHPVESPLLFACALGGGIVSASITSTGGFTHSLTAGNFDTSPASLSFNVRKGASTTFRYTGGRVNVLTIAAQIGEPVKVTYDMVFKDSTQQSDDIGTALSVSAVLPFIYTQGQYQYAASQSGLGTTTAVEIITGFELSINNNIKDDESARELGSNLLSVVTPTMRSVELKVTQRFDTTTAYNRFLQSTEGSVRLEFTGPLIVAGVPYKSTIDLYKVYLNAPDVELGGPNDILVSEFNFDCVVDNPQTTTGRDIGVTFVNNTSGY
jgi:hypothetical protein